MTAQEKTELAESRTEKAEDRTLLANERTFASWVRTAFAAIALGLGFQAIFQRVEPTWVAKGIATLFIALGIWIIWQAKAKASRLHSNSSENEVHITRESGFLFLAVAVTIGALLLVLAIWLLI